MNTFHLLMLLGGASGAGASLFNWPGRAIARQPFVSGADASQIFGSGPAAAQPFVSGTVQGQAGGSISAD